MQGWKLTDGGHSDLDERQSGWCSGGYGGNLDGWVTYATWTSISSHSSFTVKDETTGYIGISETFF